MRKLLTICPSRGRPDIIRNMIASFRATSSPGNDLLIYLNDDDPKMKDYPDVGYGQGIVCIHGPRRHLAEAYNAVFEAYPDYEYYAPINDDHVFITPRWDDLLIQEIETHGRGWGLACAEDGLTNWSQYQHPSGCVVSGNIPRALGYFVYPKIQHIGIDCYFMHLMNGIKCLFHRGDIIIEHRHWINGKALLDENYKWVYNKQQYNYGMAMVDEYLHSQLHLDVEKINKIRVM